MIPTPGIGQRWDNVFYGSVAAALNQVKTPDVVRAPEPASAKKVTPEAPENITIQSLERINIQADLTYGEASVSFQATASVAPAPEEFIVDLSFQYFNVVIVQSDGSTRSFTSGSRSLSLNLGKGEYAFMFTPGSRSHGQGYLGAVRMIVRELSAAANIPEPRVPGGRNGRAPAIKEVDIDTKPVESRASAPPPEMLVSAFGSFASLLYVRPMNGPTSARSQVSPESRLAPAAASGTTIRMTENSQGKFTIQIAIDEEDLKGELSISRSVSNVTPESSRGSLLDETA